MAFVRIAKFPGGNEKHHRAIVEALGASYEDCPGRVLFAAGPVEDGWQIVQVFESEGALDRFVQEHLGAAFAQVGDRGYPAPPEIVDFTTVDLLA